jgi:hypothetical protein
LFKNGVKELVLELWGRIDGVWNFAVGWKVIVPCLGGFFARRALITERVSSRLLFWLLRGIEIFGSYRNELLFY